MTPREPINQVIDNAASRLTHARPSQDLRATVMARIAVAQPSRFHWRYVFAGSAAAAIVLIGVVTTYRTGEGARVAPRPAVVEATGTLATAKPTVAVPPSSPLTPVVNTARVERISARVATGERTANADDAALLAWRARATPALEHLDALAVMPLELKTIDITPLGVAPLLVPALADGSNR